MILKDFRKQAFTIPDVLSHGWMAYFFGFQHILLAVILISVPVNVLGALLRNPLYAWGLTALAAPVLIIAVAQIVETVAEGENPSFLDGLGTAFRSYGKALYTGLIGWAIIAGLALLVVVPGIIWAVYYMFWAQAVGLRGLSGREALEYSKALGAGKWWKLLALGALICVVYCSVYLSLSFGAGMLGGGVVWGTVVYVIFDLFGALLTSILTILFLNLEAIGGMKKA